MDRRIGAQLFTVRDFTKTKEDLDATLNKLSKIGYKAVQISAVGPISAEDLKELCDKYDMVPVCTHRPLAEYTDNLQASIEFHKTLGCKIAGIGAFPGIREGFTKEQLLAGIDQLNTIAREYKKNGMSFAYHNHHWEFQKVDGKFIMDYFLELGEFDFILDVFWLSHAGINAPDFIRRIGSKAKVLHFKDMKVIPGQRELQMCEVMEGTIDWDSIIKAGDEAGSEWAMVEQDICQTDPFDCMKLSYNNLTTKGFN